MHGLMFFQFSLCKATPRSSGKIQKLWSLVGNVLFQVSNIRYISVRNSEYTTAENLGHAKLGIIK